MSYVLNVHSLGPCVVICECCSSPNKQAGVGCARPCSPSEATHVSEWEFDILKIWDMVRNEAGHAMQYRTCAGENEVP